MDVPVKYPYKGGTRWNFMTWADIPDARDESRVYLRRLRILQTPWFALYLHFIYQSDEDRDPHDHPFTFWSLVLRGGYTERIWKVIGDGFVVPDHYGSKTWGRWTLHKMSLRLAHMIDDLKPGTVTLVLCGPKVKDWGFYAPKFEPWQTYNRNKYADEPF